MLQGSPPVDSWTQLADKVLAGDQIDHQEALNMLQAPDEDVLSMLHASYRVRHRYFGNQVQLYFLMNAKSGLCPEDCTYCSQSKVSEAQIPKYNLLSREKVMQGAQAASELNAKTYCLVISARGPTDREMAAVTSIVPEIKQRYDLKVCACLGLLTAEQARQLKAAGVDRVNHNVNTSGSFYGEICTTHTYQDRIDTLRNVQAAGIELCSGGIVGMGESQQDLVQMAFELRELQVQSIPVNFLNPIEGTPLEGETGLNPRYCLKVLAMFRLVNPASEIRVAGGRELHLRSLQPLGLYAANSIFVGDYLTTEGQRPETDYQMIEDLGFEVTHHDELAVHSAAPQTTRDIPGS